MLKFAFDYFDLNYKNFTQNDHKIYRKKIIHRLIKYYLNEKKY